MSSNMEEATVIEGYLVIRAKRNYWGPRNIGGGKIVKATVNKPSRLDRDEICVKVGLVVPLVCFEPLNLTDAGLVQVPAGHILSPAFYTEPLEEDPE